MDAFLKKPRWKAGMYNRLLSEVLKEEEGELKLCEDLCIEDEVYSWGLCVDLCKVTEKWNLSMDKKEELYKRVLSICRSKERG